MIIAVDCDLTVVNTGLAWLKWLNSVSAGNQYSQYDLLERSVEMNYNLSSYFPSLKHGVEAMDFWRNKYLYQPLTPLKDCVDVLMKYKNLGNQIVFVSAITGQHGSSKYDFLKENFPFLDGVVFTKEKWTVGCDVLIDDRNAFLNQMPSNVKKIKLHTPYTQDAPETKGVWVADTWLGIDKMLGELDGVN